MPKRRMTLTVRLPPYSSPRRGWRAQLLRAIVREKHERKIHYVRGDRLEARVRLYLPEARLLSHDVDNLLKELLDALQGRLGGPKAIKPKVRVIDNDCDVWRVIVEKSVAPPQSHGLGHLTMRKLRTGTR
jgi:Holliday junction resolvase RusA-like endonuclease